jgi:hypothetical protein
MRPLIFVQRRQVASAFLINELRLQSPAMAWSFSKISGFAFGKRTRGGYLQMAGP